MGVYEGRESNVQKTTATNLFQKIKKYSKGILAWLGFGNKECEASTPLFYPSRKWQKLTNLRD